MCLYACMQMCALSAVCACVCAHCGDSVGTASTGCVDTQTVLFLADVQFFTLSLVDHTKVQCSCDVCHFTLTLVGGTAF